LFSFLCPQDLAFTKSIVKVFFISLHARFSFYEKHGKSYCLFLCPQDLAFEKSIVKVIFHFFARTKKRNKEMRRLKRRRTANAA